MGVVPPKTPTSTFLADHSTSADIFQLHPTPAPPPTKHRQPSNTNKQFKRTASAGQLSSTSPATAPQKRSSHHSPQDRRQSVLPTDIVGSGLFRRLPSFIRRDSTSDYDIRRTSSITSAKFKTAALSGIKRLSVNGMLFHRFRSIYAIVLCCLSEVLLISAFDVLLYLLTVTNHARAVFNSFSSVHVLIIHLLFTPILYSYGFAPLKKKIWRVLKIDKAPDQQLPDIKQGASLHV